MEGIEYWHFTNDTVDPKQEKRHMVGRATSLLPPALLDGDWHLVIFRAKMNISS